MKLKVMCVWSGLLKCGHPLTMGLLTNANKCYRHLHEAYC